ncbi:hypothetical protein EJ07DRAFT_151047 [Lizonia empirigonia]|nr:hypothetical protein EJ07DRAFT_151047 [Lizonia empirigonia]
MGITQHPIYLLIPVIQQSAWMTGPVLKYLDTISVANNEPINFVGLSYGSQLGAQYAALFPDNIRTVALDGILQHSQSQAANLLIETTSCALALSHFFKWASTDNYSALKGQNVESLWRELLTNASTAPIPALSYPSAVSFLAIGCLDWTRRDSSALPEILAQQRMAREYAPLTQGASQMWTLQHACLGWPVKTVNPPKKLDIKTHTIILLTQSTADPSTGLPWALGMMEEIDNKVLVLRNGDGHTSLPLGGETAEVIVEYLVTGKAPGPGLVLNS